MNISPLRKRKERKIYTSDKIVNKNELFLINT